MEPCIQSELFSVAPARLESNPQGSRRLHSPLRFRLRFNLRLFLVVGKPTPKGQALRLFRYPPLHFLARDQKE